MLLSFLWSAQVSDVFVHRLSLLSLFRFQGLAHAVEDAVSLPFVASLDVTLVLAAVVVAVVNVTLLASDEIPFPHAPAPTLTAALAVLAMFLS